MCALIGPLIIGYIVGVIGWALFWIDQKYYSRYSGKNNRVKCLRMLWLTPVWFVPALQILFTVKIPKLFRVLDSTFKEAWKNDD